MGSPNFYDRKLLSFFHKNKTEMSVLENPLTFLKTLKDHELIPEEKYREVEQMTPKERREDAIYRILEFIEKEKSHQIRIFWTCVAKDFILSRYPTLKKLLSKLKGFSGNINNGKRGHLPYLKHKEMQTTAAAQKKEKRRMITSSIHDYELPGPSSQQTSGQKEVAKNTGLPNPIKKKKQLLVMCGDKRGKLIRSKLAQGERCILARNQWFTPIEFEEHGGRVSSKNWKQSIQYNGIPLGKLIKDGHLKASRYTRRRRTVVQ